MARFYTSASNSRGNTTTAQGGKDGQTVHTRGWSVGVKVISRPAPFSDGDAFDVYATSGSHATWNDTYLGTVRQEPNGDIVWADGNGESVRVLRERRTVA